MSGGGSTYDPSNYGGGNFNPYNPNAFSAFGPVGGSMGNMATPQSFGGPTTQIGGFNPDSFSFTPPQPTSQPAPAQPLGPDQQLMQNFNKMYGTNYSALTQLPYNDYNDFIQRSGGLAQAQKAPNQPLVSQPAQPIQPPAPQQTQPTPDMGKVGQMAMFPPPAYPTWLYGPTAGAFGGVMRPNNVPMNYGYFPGSQTWGLQPSGSNFNAG
jgi:hypothetical protein